MAGQMNTGGFLPWRRFNTLPNHNGLTPHIAQQRRKNIVERVKMTSKEVFISIFKKIYMATDPAINMDPELNFQFMQKISDVIGFYKDFWSTNFYSIIADLLHMQSQSIDKLIVTAMKLSSQGHHEAAFILLQRGSKLTNQSKYSLFLSAELLRKEGKLAEARQLCTQLQKDFPDFSETESCLAMCEIDECFNCRYDYYQLLNYAHKILKPTSYIEIGVASGKSLALTRSGTRAIGIDPAATSIDMLFYHSLEENPLLFSMTSDDFFKTQDIASLIGQPTFDMAFIDGYHSFEQALTDFINLERMAGPSSVVFIHDCLPINARVAQKERTTRFWCGDVWRIIPCLKEFRPDLDIITFPAPPAGLAMITGFTATSKAFPLDFNSCLRHFSEYKLPEVYDEKCILLNVSAGEPFAELETRCSKLQ